MGFSSTTPSITRRGIGANWAATRTATLAAFLSLLAGLLAAAGAAKTASAGRAAAGGTGAFPPQAGVFAPRFAVADFDGDQKPDLASVRASGNSRNHVLYWIDFRLSTGSTRTVGVTASAGGLQLASRDVNGDHFQDVVITSLLTGEPIAVLLNDGQGNFTRSEPAAFPEAFRSFDFSLAAQASLNDDRLGAISPRPPATSKEALRYTTSDSPESLALQSVCLKFGCGREACRGRGPPTPS